MWVLGMHVAIASEKHGRHITEPMTPQYQVRYQHDHLLGNQVMVRASGPYLTLRVASNSHVASRWPVHGSMNTDKPNQLKEIDS